MLVVFLIAVILAAWTCMAGITLAVFDLGPREPWIWFSARHYWTGAAITFAVGMLLLFRMANRE
jgi:hypothetical protein